MTRQVDPGVPEFLRRGVLGQELLVTACGMCGGTGVGERRFRVELVGA